jgi:hypothetical protein
MKQHVNTIIISLAIVVAGYLLAKGYQSRSYNENAISVTGLGEENFTSDFIVWRGTFSNKDFELKTAYVNLFSLNDAYYTRSEHEKKVTKDFYGYEAKNYHR